MTGRAKPRVVCEAASKVVYLLIAYKQIVKQQKREEAEMGRDRDRDRQTNRQW